VRRGDAGPDRRDRAARIDAKRAQRAKIAYSLHLLEERGELGIGERGEEGESREIKPGPARSDAGSKKKTRAA
jgi:hypothetical protein